MFTSGQGHYHEKILHLDMVHEGSSASMCLPSQDMTLVGLVISLPFVFPFPRLHYEYFKGQKQNLLTVLGAYRGL